MREREQTHWKAATRRIEQKVGQPEQPHMPFNRSQTREKRWLGVFGKRLGKNIYPLSTIDFEGFSLKWRIKHV